MKLVNITCDKCGKRWEMSEDEYRRPLTTSYTVRAYEMYGCYGIDLCRDCRQYLYETFVRPMKELAKARDEWLPKRSG